MTLLHPDLSAVLDAVEIVSPSRFTIQGETQDVVEGSEEDIPILPALAEAIYRRLYVRPSPSVSSTGHDRLTRRDFLAGLSLANAAQAAWETNWTVGPAAGSDHVDVLKYGVTFRVATKDVRTRSGRVEAGVKCRVRVPKELRNLIDHYYVAIGGGNGEPDDESPEGDETVAAPLLRYYWHLSPESAAPFLAAATTQLSASGISFRIKVLADPDAYNRADAGVLYVGRRYGPRLGVAIARVYEAVAGTLRPEVPLFTRRLAAGLSMAEDPAAAESFGQHRCRVVARGLWRSFLAGDTGPTVRAETLAAVFADEGLDPLFPDLGPRSTHQDLESAVPHISTRVSPRASNTSPTARSALDAAVLIGRSLGRSAHWNTEGRLCNWTGPTPSGSHRVAAPSADSSALGPDLYGGSAGIALFLAELYALTGDVAFQRTAVGAITRSVRQVVRRPGDLASPISFYQGLPGIAYAARRVGMLTGEDSLEAVALELLDRLVPAVAATHSLDLLGGSAGAILGLLAMSEKSDDRLLALAVALGEELCRKVVEAGPMWPWDSEGSSGPDSESRRLTGLGHGASGLALALLEVYARTGRTDFLDAARGAFAYEDSMFDAREGNWPDLRGIDQPGTFSWPRLYRRFWCHGAPGIALARLRASVLDPTHSADHRAVLLAAVATTLDAVGQSLDSPRRDTSLCHGLAGLLEILLIAGLTLDDPRCHARTATAVSSLVGGHAALADGPSGLSSGAASPSLMLGLAGTGHTLLRLHDSTRVPSILLLGA